MEETNLKFNILPPRHLDDHIKHPIPLIGEQWDVVPWRNQLVAETDVDAEVACERRAGFAEGVFGGFHFVSVGRSLVYMDVCLGGCDILERRACGHLTMT